MRIVKKLYLFRWNFDGIIAEKSAYCKSIIQSMSGIAIDSERQFRSAFQAALDLVFEGRKQPNGYTEHILIRRRREYLAREGAINSD